MMRRIAIRAIIVGVIVLHASAYAEDAKQVEYGKYVCVTDRAVGIQTAERTHERFAGAIQVSPERQKFFVTIQKVERAEPPHLLKDGFIEHNFQYCFNKEAISKLDEQWEKGGLNYGGPNINDFAEWCLARSRIEVNAGLGAGKYYSTGKNVFVDGFGNKFHISSGWKFLWSFTNFAGDFYMLEGRCDLIR
jgi:hypothetical protein